MSEKMQTATRNSEVLAAFTAYCGAHPEERFWQALRNWANVGFVAVSDDHDIWVDTFYREAK